MSKITFDVNIVCGNSRNIPQDKSNCMLDVSNHDKAFSETHFIDKLCNCLLKGVDWCFIHNAVKGDINCNSGLNTQFGFISRTHAPVSIVSTFFCVK